MINWDSFTDMGSGIETKFIKSDPRCLFLFMPSYSKNSGFVCRTNALLSSIPSGFIYYKIMRHQLSCRELSKAPLFYNLTGHNWRCRKDKLQKTDMHKVGARCAGCSDGDSQKPHYFFSLTLLFLLFFSLFFKTLFLKSSFFSVV
jgi:hypothetical protein